MDNTELLVVAGSLAAAAGTTYFFFGPRKQTEAQLIEGRQEIDLTVDGGYRPDRIAVKAGVPLRVNVLRADSSACAEVITFGDLGVSRSLPVGRVSAIDLPPLAAGEYEFTCGMNMLRGRLIAEA